MAWGGKGEEYRPDKCQHPPGDGCEWCCRQCNLDRHLCPGCGMVTGHGDVICGECETRAALDDIYAEYQADPAFAGLRGRPLAPGAGRLAFAQRVVMIGFAPFLDQMTSQFLRQQLGAAGVPEGSWLTWCVKYPAPESKYIGQAEGDASLPYLERELAAISGGGSPWLLAFGARAARMLSGDALADEGSMRYIRLGGEPYRMLVTDDPRDAVRQGLVKQRFAEDLAYLGKQLAEEAG